MSFLRWFQSEEPKDERRAETKYVLKSRKEKIDVGFTVIRVSFEDGRKFDTIVYGEIQQYVRPGESSYSGGPPNEPVVSEVHVEPSLKIAKRTLQECSFGGSRGFVDDPKNPTAMETGVVRRMELVDGDEFIENCDVHYLELRDPQNGEAT